MFELEPAAQSTKFSILVFRALAVGAGLGLLATGLEPSPKAPVETVQTAPAAVEPADSTAELENVVSFNGNSVYVGP